METSSQNQKNPRSHRLLAFLLYCLPVLFFIVSYFLITTSGEDIHQGAGNYSNGVEINAVSDSINAFNHSGRITDMYAWTVIDFFDYQYSFGIDTIFRIIDVILISSTFYLAAYVILGRKPKLEIKDALVFCATFVAVIFSMFGRRLYSEFSMIHNYVPLIFITLLFSVPYLKLLLKKPVADKYHLLSIGLLLLGFLFGMSTTITPLAFFITTVAFVIIKHKELSKIPVWFYTGLIGIVIGFCISFFLSSGMNNYANNPTTAETFDYISFSDFLNNPLQTFPHLLFHLIYNSGLVLLPLLVLFFIVAFFSKSFRRIFTKRPIKALSRNNKCLLLAFSLFIFVHLFATIQIKSPPRILIPVYFAGIILIFRIFVPHIKSYIANILIIIGTIIAIVLHTVFLSIYHVRATNILQTIYNSPSSSLCIEESQNIAPHIPIINLSQEYMIVDWGYPELIYNKSITICEE